MRIGEFAAQFGVTCDTIRHYMNNGLLIPDNKTAQYQFTEREIQDMQTILKMKAQCFSLREIRRYLDICRISTMFEQESIQEAVDMLAGKQRELERQAEDLRRISDGIAADIQSLNGKKMIPASRTGVPLAALRLLACPRCGQPLGLEEASLGSRYIYSGLLRCSCGYQAEIRDGIVRTGNLYTGIYDSPDFGRGLYRDINKDFVVYMQKCNNFLVDTLRQIDLKGKVVMEGYCNGYFFLYNHLNVLGDGVTYIVVDKFPELLEMYKYHIDQLGLGLDILYIADASMNLPLCPQSIDVLVDFFDDNNHCLYFKNFYLNDLKRFLKPGVCVAGASLGYPKGAKSLENLHRQYPEGDLLGYCRDNWEKLYREAGFQRNSCPIGVITETNKRYCFACHQDGEKLYMECFTAGSRRRR